jgi:uncharacterized membrane protein YidH (DUF202 family)
MLSRLRTPILKNTGSVARDHLASERTFLAWLRTGLGFVALGIAVERFSQLDITALQPRASKASLERRQRAYELQKERAQVLVVGLMATGSGSIAYGATRYLSNMRMLEKGLFKPSFWGAGGLTVAVVGIVGAATWGALRDEEDEK